MKLNDLIRVGIFLAVIGVVFDIGGGSKPKPDDPPPVVEPYVGSMKGLHDTSRTMEPSDREWLSDAFKAGGEMVDADGRGLIADSEKAQSFVIGLLQFDYNGVFKPSKKYPSLADSIEVELTKCIGDEIRPLSDSDRRSLASCLNEMGEALR